MSHVADPALAYSFGPQRTQALRAVEPMLALAVPWGHCSQKIPASTSENVPDGHGEQLEEELPPGRDRYVPGEQNLSQNEDPLKSVKLPAGQGIQEDRPRTGAYEPGEPSTWGGGGWGGGAVGRPASMVIV